MKKTLSLIIIGLLCLLPFSILIPNAYAQTVDISAQYSSFVSAWNNYKQIFGQDVAIGQTVERTLSGIIDDPPAHYQWQSWAGQTYPQTDGFSIRIETIQPDYVYKIIGIGTMAGSQPSASGWVQVNPPFSVEQINYVENCTIPSPWGTCHVRIYVDVETGRVDFSAKWYNWLALIDATAFRFAITIAKPGGILPPFSYDTFRAEASYAYDANIKRVVMFGGRTWNASNLKSDLWTFDPETSQWASVSTGSEPSERVAASMSFNSVANNFLLFGGGTITGEVSDTWTFQFTGSNTGTWTQIFGSAPSARIGAPMVFDTNNNLFVLFGGEQYVYSLGDTWVFDPSSNVWIDKNPSTAPPQRARAAMAFDAPSGKVLLFGGLNKGAGTFLSDTWLYDAATNVWQQVVTASAPSARQFPSLASDGNGVSYLFGGWRVDAGGGLGQYLDDTWKFDMATMQWTQLFPSQSPLAQSQGALMNLDSGKFILINGWRDSPLGEVWYYDANQNTWSMQLPMPRIFDPSIDGFGFPNFGFYFTTEEEIRTAIAENPELSLLTERQKEVLVQIINYLLKGVNKGFEVAGVGGHCYGMSAAARYYFMNPNEPEPSTVAAMTFEEAAPMIRELQLSSYVNPYMLGKIFQLYLSPIIPTPFATNNLAELSRIQDSIESEGVALVLLQNAFLETPEIWKSHAILAYKVEEAPGGWTIWAYDSNEPFMAQLVEMDANGVFAYTLPYTTVEFHQLGAIVSDATVFDYLMTFLRRIYALLVHSPVELHIYDSLGNHVGPTADGALELGFYALYLGDYQPQLTIIPTSSEEAYDIVLEGVSAGSYSLSVVALDNAGAVIKEWIFDGEIVQDAIYHYGINIMEGVLIVNPDPAKELWDLQEFVMNLPDDVFVTDDPDEFGEFKKEMIDKIDETHEELDENKYIEAIERLDDMKEEIVGEGKLQPTTQSDLCVIVDHIISSIETLL